MKASPVARQASRMAKVPRAGVPGKQEMKSPLPTRPSQRGPGAPSLPKRANPHLSVPPTPARTPIPPRAMAFFGFGVFAVSTYCGYLYTTYRREVAESRSLTIPEDVSNRYNKTAPTYDAEVDLAEKAMRLGKRRKELVKMARGDVLEVSCGTGRNMDYYELGERRGLNEKGRAEVQGCRSVTFVDLSPEMVEIARQKFEKLYPEFTKVAFRAQDAREVTPSPTDKSPSITSKPYFDTVLQTMGLCSTPDPVGLLRHLGTITEPEHGRILLLEHGRSHYNWLNSILDNLAAAHADRHGCWWNRDIGEIVEQSGLEVVEVKRYHLGTTWRVVLRPKRGLLEEGKK